MTKHAVLVADHASKRFSRNPQKHRSYGARDLLREIFGREHLNVLRADEFFAVDDVSFQLRRGESIALVGRNGSGKSTLLMMIAGLLKPDNGSIAVRGRVQALINLGAGFNSALSGRENIINSAAFMGFSRRATDEITEQVIDFAELSEFIDSPIGTYSSGMKARLGFSVAVHLVPEILLVDEILAVGDYAFQNKCFIKMHEMKQAGTAMVLVSHNHTHVVQLCEKALWLEKGKCVKSGPADQVVKDYIEVMNKETAERAAHLSKLQRQTSQAVQLQTARVAKESLYDSIYSNPDRIADVEFSVRIRSTATNLIKIHDEVEFAYSFRLVQEVTELNVTVAIYTKDGLKVAAISTLNGHLLRDVHDGTVQCRIRILDFNLTPGQYVVLMPIHEGNSFLWRDIVAEIVVTAPEKLTWEIVDLRCEYAIELPLEAQKSVVM